MTAVFVAEKITNATRNPVTAGVRRTTTSVTVSSGFDMKSTVYKVEIECVYSWADYVWVWRVFAGDNDEDVLWTGTTASRQGALWGAKRAIRKLRKGRTWNDNVRPNPETRWVYPDEL